MYKHQRTHVVLNVEKVYSIVIHHKAHLIEKPIECTHCLFMIHINSQLSSPVLIHILRIVCLKMIIYNRNRNIYESTEKPCGAYFMEMGSPVQFIFITVNLIESHERNQLISEILYINQQRSHVILIVWKRVQSTFVTAYLRKSQVRNHSSVPNGPYEKYIAYNIPSLVKCVLLSKSFKLSLI